ncbi:MAG: uracil-DNA glycosylase [Bacillota bacterium]|nr:uracil-DNA glycosylase [Bacillota bacterium]MDW7683610.1 uracil-DNA glycosylase [Bacillota bacterium]
MTQVKKFIRSLTEYRSEAGVFNPWRQADPDYDLSCDAPKIRANQLEHYLRLRVPRARYILVAEALGYQGGRFSGIAMTSERILLGHHKQINPAVVMPPDIVLRTSNQQCEHFSATQQKLGFNEPTATVVWTEIMENNLDPNDVILWNIFPFHPYKEGNLLSNRTPREPEKEEGLAYVRMLRELCPAACLIAVGNHAEKTLQKYSIPAHKVPHPSMGGVTKFRQAFQNLIK